MLKVYALLAVSHLILLANALRHPASIGYDAEAHLGNIAALSRFQLPFDTHEFYSPPLPYFLPAMLLRSGLVGMDGAAKAFQLLNVVCSLGLCLFLLRICRLEGRDPARESWTLFLLALMPVYHRSFAFVRGEPMLAFFAVLSAFLFLKAEAAPPSGQKPWLGLGLSLGAMILCRQWAFLLFPAFAFHGRRRAKGLLVAFAVALAVGGWFYGLLHLRYGSAAAFDKKMDLAAVRRAPLSRNLELGLSDLWEQPVWQYRFNRPIPALYADFWTDAFSYFLVYGRDKETGAYLSGNELDDKIEHLPLRTSDLGFESNRYSVRGYFKAALVAALVPSAVLLAGFLWGLWRGRFSSSAVLFSAAGFIAWHLLYNPGDGDALKATYLLQVCPFLALLGGEFMASLRMQRTAGLLLAAAFIHNFPLLLTRYADHRLSPERAGFYRALGGLPRGGTVRPVGAAPLKPRDHNEKGLLAFSVGDLAGAERDFRSAIKLSPGRGDAYASLISMEVGERRFESAALVFEEAEKNLEGDELEEFEGRTWESRGWLREAVLGPKL